MDTTPAVNEVKSAHGALFALGRRRKALPNTTRWAWEWCVWRVPSDALPEVLGTFTNVTEARAFLLEVTS